ncbi:MAG: carboxypeptidase regulatory-like domain-containing protein [Candidatus Binatia bacterium]
MRYVGVAAMLALLAACTRESAPPDRGPASPTPAPGVAATISGTVRLAGEPPAPTRIRMTGDCAGEAEAGDLKVREGRVENAFVYVREGLGQVVFERPQATVSIDQRGCMFAPRVVGVQTGQTLEFLNSDPTLHNVHTTPANSRAANFGLGVRGAKRPIRIDRAEVMVTVKCDVHPWMRAYVGVLDHPHFAVTGADGSFRLGGLPPGEYVLESWHERFGRKSAAVKVGAGESAEVEIGY